MRTNSPNVTCAKSEYRAVEEIYIHHADSSVMAISELVGSRPIQVRLSDNVDPQLLAREIGITVERHQLRCQEMFAAFPSNHSPFDHEISGTPYRVHSSTTTLSYIESAAPETKMRCWKISVGDLFRKEYYNFSPSHDWTSNALQIEEDWSVISEICLEKKAFRRI